jgi:hypothetical protein
VELEGSEPRAFQIYERRELLSWKEKQEPRSWRSAVGLQWESVIVRPGKIEKAVLEARRRGSVFELS